MTRLLKIPRYIHRKFFILRKVEGKNVLHLGCIGETDSSLELKVKCAKELLHFELQNYAKELYGIDIDEAAIIEYGKLGYRNLFVGDVEKLNAVPIKRTFDIILFTDLVEHIDNPGLALEGIKRFMHSDSEVIISLPHTFGLPNYLRYILGRFSEGKQHVAMYNSANLSNLLNRHGFKITEVYTAYEKIHGIGVLYVLPLLFLKIFPKFGGTLICVAQLQK